MKRTILAALLAMLFLPLCAQKISILGDSYSTFEGSVTPAYNEVWYSNAGTKGNDVDAVEQTWWRQLCDKYGYTLDTNNSYSGSTITCTGYRKNDYSDRNYASRAFNLGNPDIILVFGGTNDCWIPAPIGEYKYEGWTKADLYSFKPAFAHLLHNLKTLYPDKKIYSILNCDLGDKIPVAMRTICEHYDVPIIELQGIDKQRSHPSRLGMTQICDQVAAALAK